MTIVVQQVSSSQYNKHVNIGEWRNMEVAIKSVLLEGDPHDSATSAVAREAAIGVQFEPSQHRGNVHARRGVLGARQWDRVMAFHRTGRIQILSDTGVRHVPNQNQKDKSILCKLNVSSSALQRIGGHQCSL